ncbi:hypothetical protein IQ238_17085 [Pleurocapsales cyanobacterium LEGE 06147]|nr:hypothetical protein [Pleurocapsales cyanobacterium LEGE 06147]
MKKILSLSLSALTALTSVSAFSLSAKALDLGDFLLGAGTAAGASIIINNNRRAEAERHSPVSAQEEYYRGIQDGTNGAKYDNPRDSADYDRGYAEGLRRREGN